MRDLAARRLVSVASLPGSPSAGDTVLKTGTGLGLYYYDGSAWVRQAKNGEATLTTDVEQTALALNGAQTLYVNFATICLVSGIVAPGAGDPHQVDIIAPNQIYLYDERPAVTAANRIRLGPTFAPTGDGTDVMSGHVFRLKYVRGMSRWWLMNYPT